MPKLAVQLIKKGEFVWLQGQDTTSVAVSWCLYLIASNPDVQVCSFSSPHQ